MNEPRFPVIVFDGTLISGVPRLAEMSWATRSAHQSGYFENLLIVDSDGFEFEVDEVTLVSPKNVVRTVLEFLGISCVNVNLNFRKSNSVPLSLDAVRGRVLNSMFSPESHWDSIIGFEDVISEVRSCRSILEVNELLAKYSWGDGYFNSLGIYRVGRR